MQIPGGLQANTAETLLEPAALLARNQYLKLADVDPCYLQHRAVLR